MLHFGNVNAEEALPRVALYDRLAAAVNKHDKAFVYHHGSTDVLAEVQKYGNEQKAIERATALDIYHTNNNHSPIEANPRTLVYRLVEQLRQWYAFYSYK